jgi:hypothetical protein
MDKSSLKLLPVILKYPENFFGCIRKSSYNLWNCPFSSLWLTSVCTQNLFLLLALIQHQIMMKMWERCVSFTVRAHRQEVIGRCGSFTAAAKNRSYALALNLHVWSSIIFKHIVLLVCPSCRNDAKTGDQEKLRMKHCGKYPTSITICLQNRQVHRNCNAPYTGSSGKQS